MTYSGAVGATRVRVAWTGRDAAHGVDLVGVVPAALATYLALSAWPEADLVLSAGTAGGFAARGAAIGDVFVSTGKMRHDRRIPLPGFDRFGLGEVASPPTPNMQAALGLKPGLVTSGDSLDYTDRCMEIMTQHGAHVKEMEAGAVAWAAALHGKPVVCIKAITDIVDGGRPTQEEFLENLGAAAAALQRVLPRVVEFVGGKALAEL